MTDDKVLISKREAERWIKGPIEYCLVNNLGIDNTEDFARELDYSYGYFKVLHAGHAPIQESLKREIQCLLFELELKVLSS